MKWYCRHIMLLALMALALNVFGQDEAVEVTEASVSQITVSDTPATLDIDLPDIVPGMMAYPQVQYLEGHHVRIPLYALPYSMTLSDPNWKRMWINTGALLTAGLATIGILECLPDDATAWNKADRRPLFKRWVDHVTSGPVMDHDNAVFNYILHPYGGAAYYMSARSQGFNVLQSFVYSAAVSTFFWEYGIEAFMEVPSIQDLFITPIVGSAIGEGFYFIKRHIVRNGYTLWGSPVLGNVVAFLVDPVNELIGWIAGSDTRGLFKRPGAKIAWTPVFSKTQLGFTIAATF